MNSSVDWKHKWFGVWRESGPKYLSCPSIRDFVDPKVNAKYDLDRLSRYLELAHVVATTSRRAFPCVFTEHELSGSLSCRTDGVWVWWDDLTHYMRKHNVIIPRLMLADIEENDYEPPIVTTQDIQSLEWPPVVNFLLKKS